MNRLILDEIVEKAAPGLAPRNRLSAHSTGYVERTTPIMPHTGEPPKRPWRRDLRLYASVAASTATTLLALIECAQLMR